MPRGSSGAVGLALSALIHAGLVALGLPPVSHTSAASIEIEVADMKLPAVGDDPSGRAGATRGRRARPVPAKSRRAPAPTPSDTARGEIEGVGIESADASGITVLLHLDRLRRTDYRGVVDALLQRLPSRADLLQGTSLDLVEDFDAVFVTSSAVGDQSAPVLVARHHLEREALRAALTRGAESVGDSITWREDEKERRWIGERRVPSSLPAGRSSGRTVVLAEPDLLAVMPPAFTAWSELLAQLDDEDDITAPAIVAELRTINFFKPRDPPANPTAAAFSLPLPRVAVARFGIDDSPFFELAGVFETDASALRWETGWPALQRDLRAHADMRLIGLAPLATRTPLRRDGNKVQLHVAATRGETSWLLGLALEMLAGASPS